jgi:hypothetical protein
MLAGTPEAGFYASKLAKGGVEVAVRIWFGAPVIDGEEQDRSPRWCAEVDGVTDKVDDFGCRVPLDLFDDAIWPDRIGRRIKQKEFDYLQRRARWAREHKPDHPAANPREPADVSKLPPMF